MRKINHTWTFNTPEDLIRKYIDIYSCLAATDSQWLTPREKDLFVQYVLFANDGKDLANKHVLDEICVRTNMRKESKSIYIYRSKLIEKAWILMDGKTVTIPTLFRFKDGDIPPLSVSLGLKLNHDT